MKVQKCDICREHLKDEERLWPLRPEYQTDMVKEVCKRCDNFVRAFVEHFDRIYEKFKQVKVKEFITDLRARCAP